MIELSILLLATLVAAVAADGERGPADPLQALLAPPGENPTIGPETGEATADGIVRLDSPHGSTRYLLYVSCEPVSGLQVVSRDGRHATIANVFTVPAHRRQGLAAMLLATAKHDFETVTHSTALSREGALWSRGVERPPPALGEPAHRFQYWASCPELSGELIHYITDPDRSQQITYATFAARVDLAPLRAEDHPAMYRISAPDNWAISFWRSELPSGVPIYYFDWSRIEHIFIDPGRGEPDPEIERRLAQSVGYG